MGLTSPHYEAALLALTTHTGSGRGKGGQSPIAERICQRQRLFWGGAFGLWVGDFVPPPQEELHSSSEGESGEGLTCFPTATLV